MRVRKLEVGPLAANCYLVWNEEAEPDADRRRRCLVLDPGAEAGTIISALQEENLVPELVAATHCHADHIGALDELLAAFPGLEFAAGRQEADWPSQPTKNLSYGFGFPMRMTNPGRLLEGGQTLEVAGLEFQVLSVPGHSPGSLVFYSAEGKAAFTGDTLFALNIGRGDLPGGDERQLVANIREKLLTLPGEAVVWPGHGNRTRIGTERKSNPFAGENARFAF